MEVKEKAKNNSDGWLNVKCEICGKRYHRKPYLVNRAKHHYCSVSCHKEAKKEYMKGEGNHQYGLRGELNSSWSGGRRISTYGYVSVQQIGHPFARSSSNYVFEHRLIAEKYLLTDENSVEINGKLYLSPAYVVHHKNGNRLDNRVENLEVMTISEHQSLHDKERMKTCKRDRYGRFITSERNE